MMSLWYKLRNINAIWCSEMPFHWSNKYFHFGGILGGHLFSRKWPCCETITLTCLAPHAFLFHNQQSHLFEVKCSQNTRQGLEYNYKRHKEWFVWYTIRSEIPESGNKSVSFIKSVYRFLTVTRVLWSYVHTPCGWAIYAVKNLYN